LVGKTALTGDPCRGLPLHATINSFIDTLGVCAAPHSSHQEVSSWPTTGRRARDHKLIIIAGRCGRLANRITLFATFVAWAEEQGYRLLNPTFHSYAHLFEATRKNIYCEYPSATRRSWFDVIPGLAPAIRKTRIFTHIAKTASLLNERWPIFGSKTMTLREGRKPGELVTSLEGLEVQQRIGDAKIVLVNGWTFRAPGCVHRHQEKVRAYFKPLAKHLSASRDAVEHLRQRSDLVAGVHIRRGDYAGWRQGRYFFPVSRYGEWMTELARQFPGRRVSFLVCSNEPRSPNEFPGLSVGFSTGVPVEDIYALAECDYIIGPVSSFTQWASFYGDKPLFHLTDISAHVERERFHVSYLAEVPN